MENEFYNYITGTGVIVPDTSVLLEKIQKRFTQLFGDNLDLTPSTPQGRLIELFNRSETFTLQACAAISNMLNLNTANGFVLDDLGALFLIERKPATKTKTTVILSGVPNTIIPANTRIKSTDGYIFVNSEQVTIGSDGSVAVLYSATETGAIPAQPNTLTNILDAVNGLESATNPAAPTLGQEQESDNTFRNRIKVSLNLNAIAILQSIKAEIEQIPGVIGSYCYDNFEGSTVIIDGLSVPPHSLLAVVDGGDEQKIAQAIYSKKTIGTGYPTKTISGAKGVYIFTQSTNNYLVWKKSNVRYYTGKTINVGTKIYSNPQLSNKYDTVENSVNSMFEVITKEVIDEAYGTAYNVSFARPQLTDVDINITVARKSYSGDNLEQAVKNAIITFANGDNPEVDGIVIGGSLSPFEISAAVSSELPDIFITDVKVGAHGETTSPATMTFGSLHKANILAQNIFVNITEN